MADGKRLFTWNSFDFLPGAQSISADDLADLVSIFPESEREQAARDILDAVNVFIAHARAQEAARNAPDLDRVADALSAAADAITELVRWRSGWAGLAECVAGDPADYEAVDPDHPWGGWANYQEHVNNYRIIQNRVAESKDTLWALAGMLRAVEKPDGRPRVDPARWLALRLREIYWAATGTRRLGAVGGASVRGQRDPHEQGRFLLAVFGRVGLGAYTGEGVHDLLRTRAKKTPSKERRGKCGKTPSKTR
ncbi:MAG TPA: hypothetical protein PKH31_10580 [Candidatus Sumerlaeota bacterium]|nr:hypothetical protein [Candidatus Sumerlaeota bacterium]